MASQKTNLATVVLAVGGLLTLSAVVNAQTQVDRPPCTVMQPGPSSQEKFVGWYLEDEHKLDVPVNWTVFRTYKELESYGWCNAGIQKPSSHSIVPIEVGDAIGKFRVTSGFGPRKSPCTGCSPFHAGIDINTPIGVPLFSPSQINVQCRYDRGGGGNVSEFWYDDMFHQFLHLDSCHNGPKDYGDVFAYTGGTGLGTGPHLDYRVKMKNSSGEMVRVYPPKEVLEFVVNPGSFLSF